MKVKTVTLLHPGNMGTTIGAAAAASGARVVWTSQQRSKATQERARKAGLIEVETVSAALRQCELVLSVCPSHAAISVAEQVAEHGFKGLYVDANAVSRATAQRIGEIITRAGAQFVDGGIIGPPVKRAGTTRLYLSGIRAPEVAKLFMESMLDARTIGEAPGAASALKVAYAAWTKCTDALVLAIRTFATSEGVDNALVEEWSVSQPQLERKCIRAAEVATPKAWRYVGEMKEIADTFKAAGLPSGFHDTAATLWERLAGFKDQTDPPLTVAKVVETLMGASSSTGTGVD